MIKHKLKITRSKGTSKETSKGTSKGISKGTSKGTIKRVNNVVRNKNSKTKKQSREFKLSNDQIEMLFFFRIIINYFLLLINHNTKPIIIKETILNLLKEIRNHNKYINKNTTDDQIEILYKKLYKTSKALKQKIDKTENNTEARNETINETINEARNEDMENIYTKRSTWKGKVKGKGKGKGKVKGKGKEKTKSNYQGGFYFRNIEDKGDQPVTGNDIKKLLDEMQQFFYNAKYTEEGEFLTKTDTLLSMFRGDVDQFKSYVQWYILPKYYQYTPPFLKWDNIKAAIANRKYEDLPDYLLAYQSYLRSRDEYLVEKGVKSSSVLTNSRYKGFYDKISHFMDDNIQKYQKLRNMAQGKFTPLSLPI